MGELILIELVSKRGCSRWGVGTLQSYQLYSELVPKILALWDSFMRRMENLENVCKYNTGVFCKRNIYITYVTCYDHMPAPE